MTTNLTWTKSPDGSEHSEAHGCRYRADYESLSVYFDGGSINDFWADPMPPRVEITKKAYEAHAAHISKLVAEARETEKWILCSDRLPENTDWVLIRHTGEFKTVVTEKAYFNLRKEWMRGNTPYVAEYVTHWMPLPTPPKTSTSAAEEGTV